MIEVSILWVVGGPGAGKSAIGVHSLVSARLLEADLGPSSSFGEGLNNPVPCNHCTIVKFDFNFAKHLVEVLKGKGVDPEWLWDMRHFKLLVEEH